MKRFLFAAILTLALLASAYHPKSVKASDCTDSCESLVLQCIALTGGDPSCGSGYKDCMNYCTEIGDGMRK